MWHTSTDWFLMSGQIPCASRSSIHLIRLGYAQPWHTLIERNSVIQNSTSTVKLRVRFQLIRVCLKGIRWRRNLPIVHRFEIYEQVLRNQLHWLCCCLIGPRCSQIGQFSSYCATVPCHLKIVDDEWQIVFINISENISYQLSFTGPDLHPHGNGGLSTSLHFGQVWW